MFSISLSTFLSIILAVFILGGLVGILLSIRVITSNELKQKKAKKSGNSTWKDEPAVMKQKVFNSPEPASQIERSA
jgi:hypothetical protein